MLRAVIHFVSRLMVLVALLLVAIPARASGPDAHCTNLD
jgi:hypothetical protein